MLVELFAVALALSEDGVGLELPLLVNDPVASACLDWDLETPFSLQFVCNRWFHLFSIKQCFYRNLIENGLIGLELELHGATGFR